MCVCGCCQLGSANVQPVDKRIVFGQVAIHLPTTRYGALRNVGQHHAYFQVLFCSFFVVLNTQRICLYCLKKTFQFLLASCLICALLEYVIIIMWLRSVIKMLRSVKFPEDKVLTFLILREKY